MAYYPDLEDLNMLLNPKFGSQFFAVSFQATPGRAQGFLLALGLGVTSGRA